MGPSPHCKAPEEFDIIISNSSHSATGFFDVVLRIEDNLYLYPLLFLDKDDKDFKTLKHRISGKTCPSSIMPVGKLDTKTMSIKIDE